MIAAVFGAACGVWGTIFFLFITFWPAIALGLLLESALQGIGIESESSFVLPFLVELLFIDAVAVGLMLLMARMGSAPDEDHDERVGFVFGGYGSFLVSTTFLVYLAYRMDKSMFSESSVSFWDIPTYLLSLFAIDALERLLQEFSTMVPEKPTLSAAGWFGNVEIAVKFIVGMTLVRVAWQYIARPRYTNLMDAIVYGARELTRRGSSRK